MDMDEIGNKVRATAIKDIDWNHIPDQDLFEPILISSPLIGCI